MKSAECPKCGGLLSYSDDSLSVICSYCGSQVFEEQEDVSEDKYELKLDPENGLIILPSYSIDDFMIGIKDIIKNGARWIKRNKYNSDTVILTTEETKTIDSIAIESAKYYVPILLFNYTGRIRWWGIYINEVKDSFGNIVTRTSEFRKNEEDYKCSPSYSLSRYFSNWRDILNNDIICYSNTLFHFEHSPSRKYDVNSFVGFNVMAIDEDLRSIVNKSIIDKKYDTEKLIKQYVTEKIEYEIYINYEKLNTEILYLPIYIANFVYADEKYYAVMNATDKKVYSDFNSRSSTIGCEIRETKDKRKKENKKFRYLLISLSIFAISVLLVFTDKSTSNWAWLFTGIIIWFFYSVFVNWGRSEY